MEQFSLFAEENRQNKLHTAVQNSGASAALQFAVMILAILALFVYLNAPIYPQAEQKVNSVEAVRDKLSEYDSTKRLVVVDPNRFEYTSQSQSVLMAGRNRTAKPRGYLIAWENHKENENTTYWSVLGKLPESGDQFDGVNYRNTTVELKTFRDNPHSRALAVHVLCGEYYYAIDVFFDTAGMSEQELTEREADLQVLIYSIVDQIIDGAEVP